MALAYDFLIIATLGALTFICYSALKLVTGWHQRTLAERDRVRNLNAPLEEELARQRAELAKLSYEELLAHKKRLNESLDQMHEDQ